MPLARGCEGKSVQIFRKDVRFCLLKASDAWRTLLSAEEAWAILHSLGEQTQAH
jgi:hypothetical protein